MKNNLSHLNEIGDIKMVNISKKKATQRIAEAYCEVKMKKETLQSIYLDKISKGNVLTTAKVAGILAAKKVHELIPLCHQIPLEDIIIIFENKGNNSIIIKSEVKVNSKTGPDMEALQAVTQAALTIYDMCKAIDRKIVISEIKLLKKRGGKSKEWIRK